MTHSFPTRRASDLEIDNGIADHHACARASTTVEPHKLHFALTPRSLMISFTYRALGMSTILQQRVTVMLHRFSASRSSPRSEEHTSELQSLMRISYAVFCLKNKKDTSHTT